jgi:phosphomannomutase
MLPATAPAPVKGAAEDGYAAAGDRYRQRYRTFLGAETLAGWRIGVFEHSSVASDHLCSLLYRAGADVVRLARSTTFVPVDTEAFSDEIFAPRHEWIAEHGLHAIVSTDGDGDRPLVIDGAGKFVRGDVLGLVTAHYLRAGTVVTPVTSNSGIEKLGAFRRVVRTKVGSPYVIAGMQAGGYGPIVGFEANGGTLLASNASVRGQSIARLPTRDAILPILATLAATAESGQSLEDFVGSLPVTPALSDRLQDVPVEASSAFVQRLATSPEYAREFLAEVGEILSLSTVDGPRFTLRSGDVVHFRPSGNAPELRCYVEGRTPERAAELLHWGLGAAAGAVAAA